MKAITFDAPVVSDTLLPNTAVTVGGQISFFGTNFGVENETPTMQLDHHMY
jgi:hypothetical protein